MRREAGCVQRCACDPIFQDPGGHGLLGPAAVTGGTGSVLRKAHNDQGMYCTYVLYGRPGLHDTVLAQMLCSHEASTGASSRTVELVKAG